MSDACDIAIQEHLKRIEATLEKAGLIATQGEETFRQASETLTRLESRARSAEEILKQKDTSSNEQIRALRAEFREYHGRELQAKTAQLAAQYESAIAKLEAEILRRDQVILELKRMIENSRSAPDSRQEALARIPGIWNAPQRDQ